MHFSKASGLLNSQVCSTASCPSASAAAPFLGNTVYNVAGIIDAAQNRIYVNGTLSGSANHAVVMTPHSAAPLTIGQGFQGSIDDARVYNRVLTNEEIAEINRMDTSSIVDFGNYRTTTP